MNIFYIKMLAVIATLLPAIANAQNRMIKTHGEYPYLLYDKGTDRLGGAKMTYIDTAVLLNVIADDGDLYKVQLSAYHLAYIPKEFAQSVNTLPNRDVLSGAVKATGDASYDYITLHTGGVKLPYRSMTRSDESTLMVDVFGLRNNTNWIMHKHDSLMMVDMVSVEQIEDDVLRLGINLKHAQNWGYKISYDTAQNNMLTIRLKHPPAQLSLRNLKVVIDAGHGGSNNGARGTSAVEKHYTLLLAKLLQEELAKRGANVKMTRDTDITLSMNERMKIAADFQPDVLISIHLNAAGNTQVNGVSTYYKHPAFAKLSQSILQQMATTGLNNWGHIGNFNFTLNASTEYPNALVEVAFVSSPEDEKKILDPSFRQQVANKIATGLEDFITNAH